MIKVTPAISIDENEILEQFIRSSGPGGQNVNKVATAVQLRFDVLKSTSLPREVRDRLKHLAGNRMTDEGVLIIVARRYRTREQNRRDALNRLIKLIRVASSKRKTRHKTKQTKESIKKRLESKRYRARIKMMRRPIIKDDD